MDTTEKAALVDRPRVPVRAAGAGQFEVVVLRDAVALRSMASEMETLAQQAIEPNVFYEPWMLAAALDSIGGEDVVIAVVRHETAGVTGVFPFEINKRFRGLPLRSMKSWRHIYCFLCTPLVAATHASGTIAALLDWVDSGKAPSKVVELDLVGGDGQFWSLLSEQMQARKWRSYAVSYERALYKPALNQDTGVSGKHLKELRRLERRLAEKGAYAYRALQPGEPIQPWIEGFLELEASGWKGRERTALGSDEASRNFFTSAANGARERDRIQMLAVELDGKPIAMKCNFLSGKGSFAFKIAYDEQYSKFSPGVLLELFNMRNLLQVGADIEWMDSCALPQHFMINRLWTERRTITGSLLGSRGLAAMLVGQWPRYHRLRKIIEKWRQRGTNHA